MTTIPSWKKYLTLSNIVATLAIIGWGITYISDVKARAADKAIWQEKVTNLQEEVRKLEIDRIDKLETNFAKYADENTKRWSIQDTRNGMLDEFVRISSK